MSTQAGSRSLGAGRTGGVASVPPPPRHRVIGPRATGKRKVGILAPSYGMEHLSYAMDVPGVQYFQPQPVTLRRLAPQSQFWLYTPFVLGPRTDLLHTFNQLPVNRRFVVSFEMELPRNLGTPAAWQDRYSRKVLGSDRCRQILPMSDAARNFFMRRIAPQDRTMMSSKTDVFRGAVSAPDPSWQREERRPGDPIRLLFVGGEGLRKGLGAAVSAVDRLNAGGIETHLTVISRVTEETYAVPGVHFPGAELSERLQKAAWITQHASLPNHEVRALMMRHDALVLPSVDESLGWVVIEAGLSGLPVIASDMFAIPELVTHGKTGWLLPMELDADRRWRHLARPSARDNWDGLQTGFAAGITRAVEDIAADVDLVPRYGAAARAKLEPIYLPEQAARHLEAIYTRALER